jgi:hypothetical protein
VGSALERIDFAVGSLGIIVVVSCSNVSCFWPSIFVLIRLFVAFSAYGGGS